MIADTQDHHVRRAGSTAPRTMCMRCCKISSPGRGAAICHQPSAISHLPSAIWHLPCHAMHVPCRAVPAAKLDFFFLVPHPRRKGSIDLDMSEYITELARSAGRRHARKRSCNQPSSFSFPLGAGFIMSPRDDGGPADPSLQPPRRFALLEGEGTERNEEREGVTDGEGTRRGQETAGGMARRRRRRAHPTRFAMNPPRCDCAQGPDGGRRGDRHSVTLGTSLRFAGLNPSQPAQPFQP
jgi:hypothetical protein